MAQTGDLRVALQRTRCQGSDVDSMCTNRKALVTMCTWLVHLLYGDFMRMSSKIALFSVKSLDDNCPVSSSSGFDCDMMHKNHLTSMVVA